MSTTPPVAFKVACPACGATRRRIGTKHGGYTLRCLTCQPFRAVGTRPERLPGNNLGMGRGRDGNDGGGGSHWSADLSPAEACVVMLDEWRDAVNPIARTTPADGYEAED